MRRGKPVRLSEFPRRRRFQVSGEEQPEGRVILSPEISRQSVQRLSVDLQHATSEGPVGTCLSRLREGSLCPVWLVPLPPGA